MDRLKGKVAIITGGNSKKNCIILPITTKEDL